MAVIDESDPQWRTRQGTNGREAAKSPTDYDDMRTLAWRHRDLSLP